MGFLFVVVAVVVIACVLAMIALALGTGFGLLTGSRLPSDSKKRTHGLPACGQCGYPTRGISTMNCPECGADLREVGITTGRSQQAIGVGCVVAIVFTIAVVVLANIFNPVLVDLFPDYEVQTMSIGLSTNSQAYANSRLYIDSTEIIHKNSPNSSYGGITSWSSSGSSSQFVTLSLGNPNGKRTVTRLAFSGLVNVNPPHAWSETFFEVDPITLEAKWTDRAGNQRSSNGAFNVQDMLAFLANLGVDTSKADVQAEAKELHGMMTGMAQGTTQFALTAIQANSTTGSSHYREAPEWFGPVYFFTWLVLWVVGLVFISRRGRKKVET